jgi:hypothetical protein
VEDIEKKREMIKLKRLEDAANKTEGEKHNGDQANQEVQEIPDEKHEFLAFAVISSSKKNYFNDSF